MANILIVDDEIGIRELLSEILEEEGYTTYAAENAEAARVLMSQEQFDLILLDIWMPDTDGITLLKEWGARKMLHCPVIMMSGHGTIETAVEATKFGALAFLEKPISMQKLLDTVRHGLDVGNRISTMSHLQPPAPPVERPALPPIAEDPVKGEMPKLFVPGAEMVIDFGKTMREVREMTERAYLLALMRHESYQMTRVARHAGLERTHLYRKLKALNMEIVRKSKKRRKTDSDVEGDIDNDLVNDQELDDDVDQDIDLGEKAASSK